MSSYSKGGEMSINLIVGNEEAKKAICRCWVKKGENHD